MRFFSIDLAKVIAGEGPSPKLVLAAIRALPDTSLTVALSAGGRDHYGWGHEIHALANIYDILAVNTRVSGNWGKKKAPEIPSYPRPKSVPKGQEKKEKVTVKSLFNRMKAGR